VGDTWDIHPTVAKLVFGERPEDADYQLSASLIEVRKAAKGTSQVAVIGVEGRFALNGAPNAFRARIDFTFETPQAVVTSAESASSLTATEGRTRSAARKRDEGVIDARGWITQALMAQRLTRSIPDTDNRFKQTTTKEVKLERRRLATTPDPPADGSPPTLIIPDPAPTADQANSWLAYHDPMGRFQFRHPQELRPSPDESTPNSLELVEYQVGAGRDVVIIELPPGKADTQRDREFRSLNQFRREIDADWSKRKVEIVPGSENWLPDAEWTPLKVFRKELGIKLQGTDEKGRAVERLYIDDYFILSKLNDCIHFESMTKRDDHTTFRSQVESMIKSLQFGRPGDKPNANPVTRSPSSPANAGRPPAPSP
jgi:hypothetical protein